MWCLVEGGISMGLSIGGVRDEQVYKTGEDLDVDVGVNVLNCNGLKENIRYTMGRGSSVRLITIFAEEGPRSIGVLARATAIYGMTSTRS